MKNNFEFGNKLLKKQIISSKKEISNLLKTGAKWKSNYFSAIYKKNCVLQDRFAIIVSKQNGNAVQRNKIKRIFREMFRTNKRRNPPFFDFLFKPEPGREIQQKEIKSAIVSWLSNLEKEQYHYS